MAFFAASFFILNVLKAYLAAVNASVTLESTDLTMSYIKVSSSAVNAALTATTTAFFAFSSTFYAASVVNLAVFRAASTVVNAISVSP